MWNLITSSKPSPSSEPSKFIPADNTSAVVNFFKENMLNLSWLYPNAMPPIFSKISDLINNKNFTKDEKSKEITKLVEQLFEMKKAINNSDNRSANLELGEDYLTKCNCSIDTALAYINCFYDFNIKLDFTEIKLDFTESRTATPRVIDKKMLVVCYESFQRLMQVQGGLRGEHGKENGPLELGKHENHTTVQRLFSHETSGTIAFGVGLELNGIKDFFPGDEFYKHAETIGLGSFISMLGFAYMVSSSQSMTYKVDLHKQLFTDMYKQLISENNQRIEQNYIKLDFTPETSLAFANLLSADKTVSLRPLNIERVYSSIYTTTLAEIKDDKTLEVKENNISEDNSPPELKKLEIEVPKHETVLIHESGDFEQQSVSSPVTTSPVNNLDQSTSRVSSPVENKIASAVSKVVSVVDALNLFHEILKIPKEEFNCDKLNTFIKEYASDRNITQEVLADCLGYFKTEAILKNGTWGTLLDHIFLKFKTEDKVAFLENLKNNQVDELSLNLKNFVSKTEFPKKFIYEDDKGNKHSAIEYVTDLIESTKWEDRMEGTKVFSSLMMDIYLSNFTQKQKLFLLKDMLKIQLNLNDEGVFAAGTLKRSRFYRNMLIGSMYSLSGISSFICLIILENPLTSTVATAVKLVSNGVAAMGFAWLGYDPYCGEPTSHTNKKTMVTDAIEFIEKRISEEEKGKIDPADSDSDIYFNSLKKFEEELKQFKGKKFNSPEEYYAALTPHLVKFNDIISKLDEIGATKFAFEFHMKDKNNSPLFEILETILSKKYLLNIAEDKELGQKVVDSIDHILLKIYQKSNKEELKNIYKNLNIDVSQEDLIKKINTDAFGVFLSDGLKKAQTPKDLLLHSLKCNALLKQMKDQNVDKNIIDACLQHFADVVKTAASEKGSLLFGLNQRNGRDFRTKQLAVRFAISIAIGLASMGAVVLLPQGLALGLTLTLLGTLEFALRKYVETLKYDQRGLIFKKAHRNYELIRGIVDLREENLKCVNGFDKILSENERVTFSPIPKLDLEKVKLISNSSHRLKEEVNIILSQGVDQKSALYAIARVQRLISMCKDVPLAKRILILSDIAYQSCLSLDSALAKIVKSKSLMGSGQFLIADIFLGFISASYLLVPYTNLASSLSKFIAYLTLDTLSIEGWVHEIDVSHFGKTPAYKKALGNIKEQLISMAKDLETFQSEEIKKIDKHSIIKERFEKLEALQRDLTHAHNSIHAILKVHKDTLTFSSNPKSATEYKKLQVETKLKEWLKGVENKVNINKLQEELKLTLEFKNNLIKA